VNKLTRKLIEEILRSIGLEKIECDADDEVWDIKDKEEKGVKNK